MREIAVWKIVSEVMWSWYHVAWIYQIFNHRFFPNAFRGEILLSRKWKLETANLRSVKITSWSGVIVRRGCAFTQGKWLRLFMLLRYLCYDFYGLYFVFKKYKSVNYIFLSWQMKHSRHQSCREVVWNTWIFKIWFFQVTMQNVLLSLVERAD